MLEGSNMANGSVDSPFVIDGQEYLRIPDLAEHPVMNGGDENCTGFSLAFWLKSGGKLIFRSLFLRT